MNSRQLWNLLYSLAGATASSQKCHITHASTQSFQFTVLVLTHIHLKINPFYPHFPPVVFIKMVSPASFPFSPVLRRGWLPRLAGWRAVCVHNRRQGGALTTQLLPHLHTLRQPPSARPQFTQQRPLLTGPIKHTNSKCPENWYILRDFLRLCHY